MATVDPHFEREVLDGFRRAVKRYCTSVRNNGLDGESLQIAVSVVTEAPMSPAFRGKVHRAVHQHVHALLPRARVNSVRFTVDPTLPHPGHRFLLNPPALPAPAPTLHLTSVDPQPVNPPTPRQTPHPTSADPQAINPLTPRQTPHLTSIDSQAANPLTPRQTPRLTRIDRGEINPPAREPAPHLIGPLSTAHLTLRYGADFHWVCHLAPAPGWVPLGRWTGQVIRDASVRLPEYATFLPRGELLYLRHDGHRLEFARSPIRPGYLVTIDGAPLHAGGHLIQASPAGSIGYTDGTSSSTLLNYHLAWEPGHGRARETGHA